MNDQVAVNGAKISIVPSQFSWVGWNGSVTIAARENTLSVSDEPVALESDLIESITKEIIGKQYIATGFADVPGTVVSAVVTVNTSTLHPILSVAGQSVAFGSTSGSIVVLFVPAMKCIPPPGAPLPDPVLSKTASWSLVDPAQKILDA